METWNKQIKAPSTKLTITNDILHNGYFIPLQTMISIDHTQ